MTAMLARVATLTVALSGCALFDGALGDQDDGTGDGFDSEVVSIEELRSRGSGSHDVIVQDATVTYIRQNGFFIQEARPTLGIFVFTLEPDVVSLGDSVSLRVFGLTNSTHVEGFEILEQAPRLSGGFGGELEAEFAEPIDILNQNPGPGHEARLIRLSRARVEFLIQTDLYLLTSDSNLAWGGELASPLGEVIGLCEGTSFDLIGVVEPFLDTFQIEAVHLEDFRLVADPCPVMPPPI